MRTIFMGTPDIAVPSLRMLAQHSDVALVVTQPDRPAGRGKKLRAPPVKVAAEEMGLAVWQPETLKGADLTLLADADLFVVLAYGEILRQQVLDLPRIAPINLHASLLPAWRGASPLQASLRAGDAETGVSVMRMVRALDAGPVYSRHHLPLTNTSTLPELHDALAELSATALEDFLSKELWRNEAEAQDEQQVSYCGKLGRADGAIDWSASAVDIDRHVRAYTPVPGCWTQTDIGIIGIQAGRIVSESIELTAGAVTVHNKRLIVGCGEGAYQIDRLQPPGKRAMDTVSWLNGHTPPQHCLPAI